MNCLKEFISQLAPSDCIQLMGIISSLIASIVAIIISLVTLRQNSKMIEESSRAVIGIYGESINSGSPTFFLVVKNFGNSLATILNFSTDFDFTDCYGFRTNKNWINELNNCSIAPGQSRICKLDYGKITQPVTFQIKYRSSGKTYSEKMTIDLKAGAAMVTSKIATKNEDLRTISYTLQEMLQKHL